MVLATSLVAAADAHRLRLERYATRLAVHPVVLVLMMALFWIYVFPWYLRVRRRIRRGEIGFGPPPPLSRRQQILSVAGAVLMLGIGGAVWYGSRDVRSLAGSIYREFDVPTQVFAPGDGHLLVVLPARRDTPLSESAYAHKVAVFAREHHPHPDRVASVEVLLIGSATTDPAELRAAGGEPPARRSYVWTVAELLDPASSAADTRLAYPTTGELEERARSHPDDVAAQRELAMMLLERERYSEALPVLRRWVELDAANGAAHNDLGWALLSLGRTDEAIAAFKVAVLLAPSVALPQRNLGLALGEAGDWAAAEASLRAAVRLEPDYADANIELGMVLLERRKLDEAVRQLRHAVRLAPENPAPHISLSQALEQAGKPDSALAVLDAALRLHPDNLYVWGTAGHIANLAGQHARAVARLPRSGAAGPRLLREQRGGACDVRRQPAGTRVRAVGVLAGESDR